MRLAFPLIVGLLSGILVVGVLAAAPSARAADQYLAWLLYARDSHIRWAAYYKGNPDERDRMVRQADCTGDVDVQEEWARRYDAIIQEYLRRKP